MKLSEETIEILKNYATINQGLVVKPGSELRTITPSRTVLAISRVAESFPVSFCMYDLNKFLAKISLYRDAELDFQKDRIVIKSADGKRTDYIKYSSPEIVKGPPDKDIDFEEPDYEFSLSQEDLIWQRKSAGISGSENFVFRGDGKHIYLQSNTMKDDSSDLSSTVIGDTDGTFSCVLQVGNFKLLDGSYDVKIRGGDKALIKFKHTTKDVEYYVAVESGLSQWK